MQIQPDWPAPTWIRAMTTTCLMGNLALPVKDQARAVWQNRLKLSQSANLRSEPVWLQQTHSNIVIELKTPNASTIEPVLLSADGAFTQLTGVPCTVLTADCLPVLFCDTAGTLVAAVHCGWRGLAAGILENTLKAIRLKTSNEILAWFGPAIGPQVYEVGEDFKAAFTSHDLKAEYAFQPTNKPGKWLANLGQLAKYRLMDSGVSAIYGGNICTYTDQRFYSYRRDKATGRMATLIWIGL